MQSLQEQLNDFPTGKLICTRYKKYYKWYQKDGNNCIYIPKSNRQLAEKLATKQYITLLLEDIAKELKALELYLKFYSTNIGKAEKLIQNNVEYRKLLSSYFTPTSQELANWMQASYQHNDSYPEQLIHKSFSCNLLRSKSEAMIDMFLYTNKIPFRYECSLDLGAITLFPDFTIRHPKTGKLYYWEHFGLMDNNNYAKNACHKLELYCVHGIIPSINLITTYETKEHPLTTDRIESIIQPYFL